jgi:chromosome segregation ATPase
LEKLTKKLTAAEEQAKQSASQVTKREDDVASLTKKLSDEEERSKKATEELEKQKEKSSQLKDALDTSKNEILVCKGEIDKYLREHVRRHYLGRLTLQGKKYIEFRTPQQRQRRA